MADRDATTGMRVMPRYPVYVISKGRHDCCQTARFLVRDKVPFHLVVEPQEADLYTKNFGADRLYILPFSNLGLGGIPARNWVWEHSISIGAERHWILDDNIRSIHRRWKARKIPCDSGPAFALAEDFADRYENMAITGFNYYMFSANKEKQLPLALNVHVYSTLLIQNDLPYRWRGRYNEDTDLCLQVLSGGYCTALISAFLIRKSPTMTMKGGNSDQLYQGDGRLRMARSLERVWPGVVETHRRFRRPQHVVKYTWSRFTNEPRLRPGVDLSKIEQSEYSLKLTQVKPMKDDRFKKLMLGDV
jgi:hypothetical protein